MKGKADVFYKVNYLYFSCEVNFLVGLIRFFTKLYLKILTELSSGLARIASFTLNFFRKDNSEASLLKYDCKQR